MPPKRSHAEYVALIEDATEPGRWAAQDPDEFGLLLRYLREELGSYRRVLELGTHRGGTLWALARVVAEDAVLISVDSGRLADLGPGEIALPGQDVHLVGGDSHEPETTKAVLYLLDGKQVDFLLIDGDHTDEGVRKDWMTYSPLVRSGGVIVLHDVQDWAPFERSGEIAVWKLWAELKVEFPNAVEFTREDSAGLGLIRVP